MNQCTAWNDRRIEFVIGNLLRLGVGLAGSIVLVGAGFYLARHYSEPVHYSSFHPEAASFWGASSIWSGITGLKGRAIIQLGLLVLIATPVARIIFSAIAFVAERDYLYFCITLAVLGIVAFSLFGHAIH